MCVLTGKALFRFPFQWKEFIQQCWFILRVALLPTMAVSVPVTALFIFTFNILLIQVGAADISGAGAGIAVITQIGPINTVLVIAGAVSTAICADLGARTIREEIDAMEVLGIDPIHRLVVPRVLACALCGMLLNALVSMVGLVGVQSNQFPRVPTQSITRRVSAFETCQLRWRSCCEIFNSR